MEKEFQQRLRTLLPLPSWREQITPQQQQEILNILAQYGPTEGLTFDHYEKGWDFE